MEVTGELISNKFVKRITKTSLQINSDTDSQTEQSIEIPNIYTYLSPEKRQQIIDDIRLI